MKKIYFNELSWIKENEYEYYIELNLPDKNIPEIESFAECDISVKRCDKLVPCEVKIICDKRVIITIDKPTAGVIAIKPKDLEKETLEEIDKLNEIRNKVAEYDKLIEVMYKNNTIGSNSYYTMKGFNFVLNEIINR